MSDKNARSGKDIELIDIGIYLHISGQFAEYAHIKRFSAGYDDIDRLILQRFDAIIVELRALVYDSSEGDINKRALLLFRQFFRKYRRSHKCIAVRETLGIGLKAL